ncbi:MAG: hypothetical protein JNM07_02310 [Phycisphaerae bacterium]|nr:hypothetical protein [Phycisphaerae bacterium]
MKRVPTRSITATPRWVFAAMLLVLPFGSSAAAPPRPSRPSVNAPPPRFERIDPGTQDLGPLSSSVRVLDTDLRLPSDFKQIYRIRQYDALGRPVGADRFGRASGAVTAVFPRSVYTPTSRGLVTEIPAGTIWYIGDIPNDAPLAMSRAARIEAGDQANPTLDSRAESNADPIQAAPATTRSLIDDPAYRAARVREILRKAAASPSDAKLPDHKSE